MIEAAKLSRGQYLSDKDIAALQVLDEEDRAYERALDTAGKKVLSLD